MVKLTRENKMKILLAVVVFLSGCTGIEMGGKLWVTRVDEKQESQRTHNVPLKCYLWENCNQVTEQEAK